jgi:DNA-binding NtrC family response regulator
MDYEVESHTLALGALQAFESAPATYDMAIVDLALPDMSGDALLAKLLDLNPSLLMLVCSGAPFSPGKFPMEVQDQICFLQKPFAPSMLVDAVAQLLARRRKEESA